MSTIDTSIDIRRQLTIQTVTGEVSSGEIVNKIKTYYEGGPIKFLSRDH